MGERLLTILYQLGKYRSRILSSKKPRPILAVAEERMRKQ